MKTTTKTSSKNGSKKATKNNDAKWEIDSILTEEQRAYWAALTEAELRAAGK